VIALMYGLNGDCTITGLDASDLSNEVSRPLQVETVMLLLLALGFSNK